MVLAIINYATATQIDVFHLFTSLKWSQCCKLPESMLQAQAMWLKDQLYVGGGTTCTTEFQR